MSRRVVKFGGTSVADMARIAHVAGIVEAEAKAGEHVVAVVSAMAGETNRLATLAAETGDPAQALDARLIEYDSILATGEQLTAALLARVLQARGFRARSWLGWQIPIRTDERHGSARIVEINPTRLCAALDQGEIAVVAGFQGLGPDGRITTIGRGGTDLTAVAVAAAIGAESCDIYTDVDGVYTADPRIAKKARRLERVSFEEMLELAAQGAKVLQTRSVELAMARRVRLRVLSSFDGPVAHGAGTVVCGEEELVEKRIVSGIASSRDEAKISLLGVSDEAGVAAGVFSLLAEAGVNVDIIVQSPARAAHAANLTFSMHQNDLDRARDLLTGVKDKIGYEELVADAGCGKISVVGVGMKTHAGVAATMLSTLAEHGINIHAISTSEIKISVLIDEAYTELAVRALHAAYGLDAVDA